MSTPLSTDIRPGAVLAGKYRIEKVLGQGAMGVVVAARHLRLDEDVAIKFLLPAALENPETIARFEREARSAAKIRSEHIARVRDVGRLESGAPYMVMEHLDGMDLKQYLGQVGPLPVKEAIHYLLQASEALAEAHALGIVHRDLKPANMFRIIRTDGTPSIKILDFGISKLQNADVAMTQTATMMGSPYYMSPEQMTSSKDVDARTDIWALGVILYQLLTCEVPFGGESIGEVCTMVLCTEPPRLSEMRDDIPLGLQAVLDRALLKDRTKRLSNVAEFAQSLVPFGQDGDVMSADRVSRVLGFIPQRTVRKAGTVEQSEDSSPIPEPHVEGEQTLAGAAHSTREQIPTKRPIGAWIWGALGGFTILLGAGVYFSMAPRPSSEEPSSRREDLVVSSPRVPDDIRGPAEKEAPQAVEKVSERAHASSIPAKGPSAAPRHSTVGRTALRPETDTPAQSTLTSSPPDTSASSAPEPAAEIAHTTAADSAPGASSESEAGSPPKPPPDPLEHYRDRR